MKAASPALIALLATGQFEMADLYTITFSDGSEVRWTGADREVEFGGNTWALGPTLDRGTITNKSGIEVSSFSLDVSCGPEDLIDGVPLMAFTRAKGFDGATLLLERAYLATWASAVTGTMIDFDGRINSVNDIGPQGFSIRVVSEMVLLNAMVGPDLIQPACLNTLFDSGCGLSAAAFAVNGAVAGSGQTRLIFDTNLGQAAGYFNQGRMVFTSGANNGLRRAVKLQDASGILTLSYPLAAAPAPGDTFTIYPGCDRKKATCESAKFNNKIHFRGMPFVPAPEAAVI